MERGPRPREQAIEYQPQQENPHQPGSREWYGAVFDDLLNGYQDMPEQKMRPEDYPKDEANEVVINRYRAHRRNKRTVAWFNVVASCAELFAEQHVRDTTTRQRILDLSSTLRTSVNAQELTTDAQVSLGDSVINLCIDALRTQEEAS